MMQSGFTTSVRFSGRAWGSIHAAVARAGGSECCGVLLGCVERGRTCVTRTVRVPNASPDPAREFLITPSRLRRIERRAARAGLIVHGFFHSHPAGTSSPSARDHAAAWPHYLYLIVTGHAGRPTAAAAWRLRDDRSGFDAVPITLEAA